MAPRRYRPAVADGRPPVVTARPGEPSTAGNPVVPARLEYARAYREDGVAAYRVTVIDDAGRGHTYLVAFSNEADGSRRGSISNGRDGDREACWRLAGILPE